MDKKVDITDRYKQEILDIQYKLDQLDKGRVYEISNIKTDGYLSTNIDKLRRMIEELIYKIEYCKESKFEELKKALDKIDLY